MSCWAQHVDKVNVACCWNYMDREKTKYLNNPVPVQLCPPQIPLGMTLGSRPATTTCATLHDLRTSGVPRNFFRGGGVQQIQLRTEGREDGDLGAIAP